MRCYIEIKIFLIKSSACLMSWKKKYLKKIKIEQISGTL